MRPRESYVPVAGVILAEMLPADKHEIGSGIRPLTGRNTILESGNQSAPPRVSAVPQGTGWRRSRAMGTARQGTVGGGGGRCGRGGGAGGLFFGSRTPSE